MIQRELDRYLPFLATTKVLMSAVRNGVGREAAHEAIKENAVGVALEMRQGLAVNDLFDRLAADERLGLTRDQIDAPSSPSRSPSPVPLSTRRRRSAGRWLDVVERHPAAASYVTRRDPLARIRREV